MRATIRGRHNCSLEGYFGVYQVKKAGKTRRLYNREYKIIVLIIVMLIIIIFVNT